MKKLISSILGTACVASMMIACAENADGSCDLVWTLSWLAAAIVLGWLYTMVDSKPIKSFRR